MATFTSKILSFNEELNYKENKESNPLFVSRIELVKTLRNIHSSIQLRRVYDLYKLQFTGLVSRLHLPNYIGFQIIKDQNTSQFLEVPTKNEFVNAYEWFIIRCVNILEYYSKYQLVCSMLFFEGVYSLYYYKLNEFDFNFKILFTNHAIDDVSLVHLAYQFDFKNKGFEYIHGHLITPSVHGVYWSDPESAKQFQILSGSDILYGQSTLWFLPSDDFNSIRSIMGKLRDDGYHLTMHWIHEQDYQLHCHVFHTSFSLMRYLFRISTLIMKQTSRRSVPSILLYTKYDNVFIQKMYCLFAGAKYQGIADDLEMTLPMAKEAISALPMLEEFDNMILEEKFLLCDRHDAFLDADNADYLSKVTFSPTAITTFSSKYIKGRYITHSSSFKTRTNRTQLLSTVSNAINLLTVPMKTGSSPLYQDVHLYYGGSTTIIERNQGWVESLKLFREMKVDYKFEIDSIMNGNITRHIRRNDCISESRKNAAILVCERIRNVPSLVPKINASFFKLISIFTYLLENELYVGNLQLNGPAQAGNMKSVLLLGAIDDPLIPLLKSFGVVVESIGSQAIGDSRRTLLPNHPNPGPNELIISDIGNSYETTDAEIRSAKIILDWIFKVSEWRVIVFKVITLTPYLFNQLNHFIQHRLVELGYSKFEKRDLYTYSNIRIEVIQPQFRKYGSFESYIIIINTCKTESHVNLHINTNSHPFINADDKDKKNLIRIKSPRQLKLTDSLSESNWGRPCFTLGMNNLARQQHAISYINSITKLFITYPVGSQFGVGVSNFGIINPGACILSAKHGPFLCDNFLYNFSVTGDRGICDVNQLTYVSANQMVGHMFKMYISELSFDHIVIVGLRNIDDFVLSRNAKTVVVRDLSVNILPDVPEISYVYGDAIPWICSDSDELDVVGQTVFAIDVFMSYKCTELNPLPLIVNRINKKNETWFLTLYTMDEDEYKTAVEKEEIKLPCLTLDRTSQAFSDETFAVKMSCGRYIPEYIWKWNALCDHCDKNNIMLERVIIPSDYYYKCISYGYRPTSDAICYLDKINLYYYCCRLSKKVS